MKTGEAGINAHLTGTVLTLAECYRLELKNSSILGLTGHDATITYDGVDYLPSMSVSRSAISSKQNLSVDNLDITGLIDSVYIKSSDILAGMYDDAEIFIFTINYANTSDGIIKIRRGTLGNIVYEKGIYRAEVRGMFQKLNKSILRVYSPECDAEFGNSDTGCGYDLSAVRQTGSINVVTDRKGFSISGVTIASGAVFVDGRITFTSGLNNGLTFEIKTCDVSGNMELFLPAAFTVTNGDAFTIVPGCLKSLAACKLNGQVENFRGFPFIRGNKDLLKYETGNV